MQLIPSIDLRGGQCVRLLRGDFSAETRYDYAPLELLRHYRALGCHWLHMVDLDGARDGQLGNRQVIAQLASEAGIRLQVGGGIRTREVVEDLLTLGVSRLAIGSAAVDDRSGVIEWFKQFGPQRICLAFDVQLEPDGIPLLRTRGWQQSTALPLWDAVESYLPYGLQHVLCTDIARDGALAGPNVALYTQATRRFPQLHWQASGGVSHLDDLQALAGAGVSAAISGRALLEGRLDQRDLQPYLPGA